MRTSKILIAASVVAAAIFALSPTAQAFNIFGWDTREEKSFKEAPYNRIVFIPAEECSGALVWKNLVLTAAHCVSSMVKQNKDGSYSLNGEYWVYSRKRGPVFDGRAKVEQLWWGTLDYDNDRAGDWAIIRLDRNLSEEQNGYFGFLDDLPVNSPNNFEVQNAGYSADLLVDGQAILTGPRAGCTIREHDGDLVYHDCDNTRGSSGSPIWKLINNDFVIVAIHVAEFRANGPASLAVPETQWDKYKNVGLNARAFAAKIKALRAEFPDGAAATPQGTSNPPLGKDL